MIKKRSMLLPNLIKCKGLYLKQPFTFLETADLGTGIIFQQIDKTLIMTKEYDWSQFVCKININSTVESIYDAWTIPRHLETWFLRSATFRDEDGDLRDKNLHLRAGDTYEWFWYGYADNVVEKGKVLAANGMNKLQFSFTRGAEVIVDIGTSFNETIVMLTQSNMPDGEDGKRIRIDCMAGWSFYLANFKSRMARGIDLRNKNVDLINMVNS